MRINMNFSANQWHQASLSLLSLGGYIGLVMGVKANQFTLKVRLHLTLSLGSSIRNIYEHSEWKLIYKNIFSSNNLPDKIATCSSLTRFPMHLCNIYNRIDTPDQFRIKSRDLDLYSKKQSWNNVMIEKCQI